MAARQKATDIQITDAYAALGSVTAVAQALGMCGQSVHERLVRLGKNTPINIFSANDEDFLRDNYQNFVERGELSVLAAQLGRTRQFLCRKARAFGLTDRSRPKSESAIEEIRRRQIDWHKKNEHPKGFLGHSHTLEAKKRIAAGFRNYAKTAPNCVLIRGRFGASWKAGWRDIAGNNIFFRSRWEANYARYLQFLFERGDITDWKHEPETFWFEEIDLGVASYLPDFRVVGLDGKIVFHEVKGWMDKRSAEKLRLMALYRPEIPLIVIRRPDYRALVTAFSSVISEWEK